MLSLHCVLQEKVFEDISNIIGADGRILQKRLKGFDIKFQIIPPKKSSTASEENETSEVK